MEEQKPKTKVLVRTKSGKSLAYYENGTYEEIKEAWRSFMTKNNEAVSFGNFVVRIDTIDYVTVLLA